jgi:actin-related protein
LEQILRTARSERIRKEREIREQAKEKLQKKQLQIQLKKEAKIHYMQDQVKLLQEKLEKARIDECIAKAAKQKVSLMSSKFLLQRL